MSKKYDKVMEFLDCVDNCGFKECEKEYKDIIGEDTINEIKECLDKCYCDELGIHGTKPEYDEFCREKCVCVES